MLWLRSSPTYSWSGCLGGGSVEAVGDAVEGGAGELPLERGGDLLAAAAEREELLSEGVEVGEVVGVSTADETIAVLEDVVAVTWLPAEPAPRQRPRADRQRPARLVHRHECHDEVHRPRRAVAEPVRRVRQRPRARRAAEPRGVLLPGRSHGLTEGWRIADNAEHLRSSLGYRSPKTFVAAWVPATAARRLLHQLSHAVDRQTGSGRQKTPTVVLFFELLSIELPPNWARTFSLPILGPVFWVSLIVSPIL